MSKMTQRRMSRRASRKLNVARRENRRAELRITWLSQNLDQAFTALRRMAERAKAAGKAPADSTPALA